MPRKKTQEEVIKDFIDVHGDRYDYSKVDYKSNHKKVEIVCPEHGSFLQTPGSHKAGCGCDKCGHVATNDSKRIGAQHFIDRAIQKHGAFYDYSEVIYKSNSTDVTIKCPEHGCFTQRPANHLNGAGCPSCAKDKQFTKCLEGRQKTFKENAALTHNGLYDYSNVNYINNCTNVSITCPVHGVFDQSPANHIKGHGCPSCVGSQISVGEEEILNYVKSFNVDTEANSRNIIPPYELDIYIPDHNLAIEYNGLYWHSTACISDRNYHLRKTQMCEEQGIRLIHIYEDEWLYKSDRVKSMLSSAIGTDKRYKVDARKCRVRYVGAQEAASFCDTNHIQGMVGASVKIGLYHDNELVAYMGFRKEKGGVYDLNRYCTSANVRGGFSKLLSYFKKNYEWSEIYTYAERRYSQGNLYLNNGFELVYKTRTGYDYIKGKCRYGRQQFMKHKLHKKLEHFDPDLTEEQNMLNNGYYRIYDCGVLKFVMYPDM